MRIFTCKTTGGTVAVLDHDHFDAATQILAGLEPTRFPWTPSTVHAAAGHVRVSA